MSRERPVRITITGTARQLADQSDLLRVQRQDSGVFLVDVRDPGTTVEWVQPRREWTTGDVVAGDCTVYLRQHDGRWLGTAGGHPCTATDQDMTDATDVAKHGESDAMTVLRYQAGEQ